MESLLFFSSSFGSYSEGLVEFVVYFRAVGKIKIKLHSSTYRYPVIPTQFAEEAVLSPMFVTKISVTVRSVVALNYISILYSI